ncbi:MAG: outer membrane lipoprotein carrier protein LolA [Deltaproteobacteria bacterium]
MAILISVATLFAPVYALGIEKGRRGQPLGLSEAGAALKRLSGLQAGISSMTARTVQTKTSPLLEGVVRTDGRIWIKRPAFLKWEIDRPERLVIVADAESMTVYRPKAREATRRLLANDMSARYTMEFFSSGMTLSMEELSKRFSVSVYSQAASTVVELRPKSRLAGRFLKKAVIAYSPDGIPEWFEVENANGAITRTELGSVDVNTEIPQAAFKLQLPGDVVVRQLGEEEVR